MRPLRPAWPQRAHLRGDPPVSAPRRRERPEPRAPRAVDDVTKSAWGHKAGEAHRAALTQLRGITAYGLKAHSANRSEELSNKLRAMRAMRTANL